MTKDAFIIFILSFSFFTFPSSKKNEPNFTCSPRILEELRIALWNENYEAIDCYLDDLKGDPNVKDTAGLPCLARAASKGYLEIVHLLLNHKADINGADTRGTTPLMWAALCGHYNVVGFLLKRPNIKVNMIDKTGRTALMYAAQEGDLASVKLLIDYDANPGMKIKNKKIKNNTALKCAIAQGHDAVVVYLKEKLKEQKKLRKQKRQLQAQAKADDFMHVSDKIYEKKELARSKSAPAIVDTPVALAESPASSPDELCVIL